jgi:hypothetical protein
VLVSLRLAAQCRCVLVNSNVRPHQTMLPREAVVTSSIRTWVAFACASLTVATVLGAAEPLSGVRSLAAVGVSIVVFLPFSAAFVLGIGGPLYLAVSRLGYVRWWSATLGGLVGGLASVKLFALPNEVSLSALLLWGAAGLAGGLTFWLILPRKTAGAELASHEV